MFSQPVGGEMSFGKLSSKNEKKLYPTSPLETQGLTENHLDSK